MFLRGGGRNQCEMQQAGLLGELTVEISLSKGAPDEGLREGLCASLLRKPLVGSLALLQKNHSLGGLTPCAIGRKLFP